MTGYRLNFVMRLVECRANEFGHAGIDYKKLFSGVITFFIENSGQEYRGIGYQITSWFENHCDTGRKKHGNQLVSKMLNWCGWFKRIVSDRKPASDIKKFKSKPHGFCCIQKSKQFHGCRHVILGIENLRADMHVEADKSEMLQLTDQGKYLRQFSFIDTEFLFTVASGDIGMGFGRYVRINSYGD